MPYHKPLDIQYYRSIFLSDFHIGSKKFDATALLDFLRKTDSDYLYLVGDIIDGWKLQKRWYWTETTSLIFDEIFRKIDDGTKIIYITGNHDERVRDINFLRRLRYAKKMGITIKNKIVHDTADGREFLVIHGDQFDNAILRGPVSRWTDRLYDALLDFFQGKKPPTIEINGVTKRFSLAKFITYHGQIALNILNDFENALVREAKRSDVSGIICGHTHIPALKFVNGLLYANCGSWIKGQASAVVEDSKGNFSLVHWTPTPKQDSFFQYALPGIMPPSDMVVDITQTTSEHRWKTLRLIAGFQRLWPAAHRVPEPQVILSTRLSLPYKIQSRITMPAH